MGNRLGSAQSAYLRQHAQNPVDWWPWGAEAFAEAARRDVPVFVSIGYAACHWCHVMAHESFEDNDAAAFLNARFLSIKVDREEHPDVDDAYMAAVQAMTGQGGWPMSVFTLPDGRVFHAGTYFPPQRLGQVPSFMEVLHAVHEAWTHRRVQVQEQAARIAEALGSQRRRQAQLATTAAPTQGGEEPRSSLDSAETIGLNGGIGASAGSPGLSRAGFAGLADQVLEVLAADEDTVHGGFGAAPKFPPSPMLTWLLEESAWAQRPETAAEPGWPADAAHLSVEPAADRAGGLAMHTMEAMARSALFDQVEGGFARYTVDRAWQLPHFEKMLYDNAQLLGAYARLSVHPAAELAVQETASRAARMTIDWLQRRMLTDHGLLASSLDADTVTEGGSREEGATYLFSDQQLFQAGQEAGLSEPESRRLAELNFGVPADEHALRSGAPLNITDQTPRTLHFQDPLSTVDQQLWERVLPQLRQIRAARVQPARDDKVVAAWNAQAVRSIAEAAALWNDPELLVFAEVTADRLWQTHAQAHTSDSAAIFRTSYQGAHGGGLGTLADHAQVANMCFALVSAGAEGTTWLDRGTSVLRFVLNEFVEAGADQSALQVLDTLDTDGLLATVQGGAAEATPVDGPEPSSIAALAQALQQGEALGLAMQLPAVKPDPHPGKEGVLLPLQPADLLHHLALIGPQAPLAVGGSLLAAGRAVQRSPAFRVTSGSAEDIAEVRQAGTLLGIPVEPLGHGVVPSPDQELQLSICLNSTSGGMCLASQSTVAAALAQLNV
ncbi:thioredoxin domain-containing protein [Nesterenkonia alkaliphila]|uniref:DUF255 domain-containing protein n=1 Tax=Nesterenkonia alkaliphila TaxID=1463631 RepID=A0A7K1UJK4_9MICC|nr:DUF255 domain-containing protein [Nesterenkonia alkaliphila]MVT26596.1 DUF255 domain-containing protein [Nesterenkonia alkaliphila]